MKPELYVIALTILISWPFVFMGGYRTGMYDYPRTTIVLARIPAVDLTDDDGKIRALAAHDLKVGGG